MRSLLYTVLATSALICACSAPGLRPHYHADYYAAFVLDPDGHRIEAVCHSPAKPVVLASG